MVSHMQPLLGRFVYATMDIMREEQSEEQNEEHSVDSADTSIDNDEYIDTQHVMTLLHVSKSTVCRMIQSGRLVDARQDESKRWHVRRACVMEVLEQLRTKRAKHVTCASKPRKQRAWYDIQPIIEMVEMVEMVEIDDDSSAAD